MTSVDKLKMIGPTLTYYQKSLYVRNYVLNSVTFETSVDELKMIGPILTDYQKPCFLK